MNRKHITDTFAAYTKKYDATDGKIKLKIDHTYRVAEFCEQIAKSIELCEADVDLAWAIGMLHDIGRFEQVKRYNTFIDSESVDHAQFGADLLFQEGLIQLFFPETDKTSPTNNSQKQEESMHLLELAIREHSNYRIREGLSKRETMFCNIIRDADKIDILRVNVETPKEVIYNVTTEALQSAKVADAVMQSFFEEHCILRSIRESAVDNVVGHISLVYELVYPISLKIVAEQGYLEQLMDFETKNEVTKEQFQRIRDKMHRYLNQ